MIAANIFTTLIVQPIFNLLVFIYGLLPGHNFGLAIIIFTILIRILMWPLVKKQLNHAKAMRELMPELKKIKKAAKGDRQKESRLTMELYREREINPFASIGILLVQLPILLGLYSGLNRLIKDPNEIVSFSYSFVQNLPWIEHLSTNIHKFDDTLIGLVNLTRPALGDKGIYWAGMLIAAASAIAQYYQTKQLMPQAQDARSLRSILKEAGQGKSADQTEVNAAVGRTTLILIPGLVFVFAVNLPLALPLYWLTSSVVAIIQQYRVLREDAQEADASVTIAAAKPIKPTSSGVKVTRRTLGSETKSAKNKKSARSKKGNKRRRK